MRHWRNAAKAFRQTGRNAAKAFRETGRNAAKAFRQTGRNGGKAFRKAGRRHMRHVDDGSIHAWLDGAITDPAERAWIEEHLRWCAACGARVAEERSTLEQAHALLAVAAPAKEPPSFEEIAARAARHQDSPRRPA